MPAVICRDDVLANDDWGLVITTGRAWRRGQIHEWRAHGLYRFRDGKISECWILPEDQRQLTKSGHSVLLPESIVALRSATALGDTLRSQGNVLTHRPATSTPLRSVSQP